MYAFCVRLFRVVFCHQISARIHSFQREREKERAKKIHQQTQTSSRTTWHLVAHWMRIAIRVNAVQDCNTPADGMAWCGSIYERIIMALQVNTKYKWKAFPTHSVHFSPVRTQPYPFCRRRRNLLAVFASFIYTLASKRIRKPLVFVSLWWLRSTACTAHRIEFLLATTMSSARVSLSCRHC